MNTPSDRSALFVKEDGLIYVNEVPQEPHYIENNRLYNTVMHHQLQAAKDSAVLCQDQEKARELLFLKHCIFPKEIALKQATGIYPIPDLKWKKYVHCDAYHAHEKPSCFSAVLSPSSIEDPSFLNHEAWHSAFEDFNKSHKQQIKPYEQLLQFLQRRFLLHSKDEKRLRFCDKCGECYDTSKGHECYYTPESQIKELESKLSPSSIETTEQKEFARLKEVEECNKLTILNQQQTIAQLRSDLYHAQGNLEICEQSKVEGLSETKSAMTLQECKEEVAEKHHHWKSYRTFYLMAGFPEIIQVNDEAAELYAAQFKSPSVVEQKLQAFKDYVHDRLDKMGIPSDPEPENNASHGCRIEGRLNFIEKHLSDQHPVNLNPSKD